ncbi:dephospho-CoA kinase [Mycolicibacterium cosmeticum]|uniref:Dephospho-CoA kinase n=1 Tax=Mycolicibacterium cosmeticum TaxID=258533 RepID=W9ALJ9_MYCCO|nr:dephospho-CoA kinase [Mycolicibacterium cosmeticum]TLH71268.1 dephospho-CoA kinase [Mycolicibacterium cosmeticum]CDO06368.1 dephospho-CoA kinase/protein folding accessory domain-containing protein [Mycolicibacterium cosmeticum]
MLRIGLTGGIGAGKSTVSSTFSELGGIVVDGDVISREVVEPGTEGLARLVEAFGDGILQPDGALNRPALAAVAFSDEEKRQTLNGIVHPLVAHRRSELIEAAGTDAVIVEDIPLLVESHMAPMFPLVVVVHADPELRVKRLIEYRGFTEADARARIAAQATEEQRRAVADVWLDNSGSPGELVEKARWLWHERILPFAHNLKAGVPARREPSVVTYDPDWAEQAQRIIARLNTACGHRAVRIDHIGSTAVPGMDGKDVIDIQITVPGLDVADELADALLAAGYPRVPAFTMDSVHGDDPAVWHKRFHASADPGRPTNVHLRVDGWPNQRFALLFVAWLRANPGVRADYLAAKHAALAAPDYAVAKEPWFLDNYRRAQLWAEGTGWQP